MTEPEPHQVPKSLCLSCGYKLDSCEPSPPPDPGDFTICIQCGHIMAFAQDLTLRELTDDESDMTKTDRKIFDLRTAIRYLRGKSHDPATS